MQIQRRVAATVASESLEADQKAASSQGAGAEFMPEMDDEVLVAFAHADPRFPFVIGSLWNSDDKPPVKKD